MRHSSPPMSPGMLMSVKIAAMSALISSRASLTSAACRTGSRHSRTIGPRVRAATRRLRLSGRTQQPRSPTEWRCYSSARSELVGWVSGPREARSVQNVAIRTQCAWRSGSRVSRESCVKSAANRRHSRLYSRSLAEFDTTYPLDWTHLSHSAQGAVGGPSHEAEQKDAKRPVARPLLRWPSRIAPVGRRSPTDRPGSTHRTRCPVLLRRRTVVAAG